MYIYIHTFTYIFIYLYIFSFLLAIVWLGKTETYRYNTHYILTENEQNSIKRSINKSVTFNEFVSK